ATGPSLSLDGWIAGSKVHNTLPQARRSLHRYPYRTRRHPLRRLTEHFNQGRLDIQRTIYTLSPALDESPLTREQRYGRRPLTTHDGPVRLGIPALYPFKEPPGDASAHTHHVPPKRGIGAGKYPTEAGAVCAARNRRHHRKERSA